MNRNTIYWHGERMRNKDQLMKTISRFKFEHFDFWDAYGKKNRDVRRFAGWAPDFV